MLGVKLGREEVGMRELSLQEIEEQLFDKEMSVEEDLLDNYGGEELKWDIIMIKREHSKIEIKLCGGEVKDNISGTINP